MGIHEGSEGEGWLIQQKEAAREVARGHICPMVGMEGEGGGMHVMACPIISKPYPPTV